MEKFSYATNGYNCEEVNQFISDVIVQTENIVARCKEQRREIEELKKELEHYMEKVNSFSDDQAVVIKSACGTTLSVSPSVYLASGEAVAAFINYIKNGLYVNYIGYNAFSFKMNGRLM